MIWPVLVILAAILKTDEKQENLLNICFIIYYKKDSRQEMLVA